MVERHGRKRADARPLGRVVHVLIQRQAVAQAVDQPVVHDEVHAAVAADLAGLILDVPDDRILVLLHQRGLRLFGNEGVLAQVLVVGHAAPGQLSGTERIALDGIFVGEALGSRKLVHAAVRTRRVNVVLQVDRAALLGLDERQRVVSVGEGIDAHLLPGGLQAVHRLGVHRHQVVHLVAAVDAEQLAGGTQTVRGVNVAAVLLVEVQTPVTLVVVPELVEVVDVGALDMQNLAEKPVARHVERRQLEKVIDAVLEHHAVALVLLGGVHQLPALLERRGGRHLDGHMLAVLHGVHGHRHVLEPRRGDIHQVDVVALAELFPALLAAVRRRLGEAALRENPLRALHPLGIEVAERLDLHAVEVREPFHGSRTTHTQPDKAHADRLHGRRAQPEHRLLARFAFGRVEHDHAVHPLPALLSAAAGREEQTGEGA